MTARPETLLVVDDHDDIRDMISLYLQREGFRTLTAHGGPEALARLESDDVSLVLLDVMMPGMSGIEVLERIRRTRSPAQLPVIMLTARSESDDVVEALGLGANDYVTKPVDVPVVLARVKAHLRMREAAATDPAPALAEGDAATAPGALRAGMVLAGRYRLEARIGSGSFGTVYRARHAELDHAVAVKVLQASASTHPDAVARFRREGVSACRVKHPNAVQVLDFGVTPGGIAYLVMELLAGYSLEEELKNGRTVPLARTARLMAPVCEALAAAHRSGIVHRDVKPANIFLHQAGGQEVPKVLDFGIARLAGEAAVEPRASTEGFIVGTPVYMAPERFRSGPVDGRSDVYSVGVTLYQMLTGRLPFAADAADPVAVAMRHIKTAPPRLRDVNPDLPASVEKVVLHALRKRPDQRPDAEQLGRDLTRAASGRARRSNDRTRTAVAAAPAAGPAPGPPPPTQELPALGPPPTEEMPAPGPPTEEMPPGSGGDHGPDQK